MTGADRLSEGERREVAHVFHGASWLSPERAECIENLIAARTAQAHADGWNEARAELLPTLDALKAERDAALAAVAGIEEVARQVLGEHAAEWRGDPDVGRVRWVCSGGDFACEDDEMDHFRAHQAERIATTLARGGADNEGEAGNQ